LDFCLFSILNSIGSAFFVGMDTSFLFVFLSTDLVVEIVSADVGFKGDASLADCFAAGTCFGDGLASTSFATTCFFV